MNRAILILFLLPFTIHSSDIWVEMNPDLNAGLDFELAYTGFDSPVDIASTGGSDDRIFVVERPGVIKIIENGIVLPTAFLDIDNLVLSGGERGLLGLVFHPDYASNGYFFVHYTNNSGDSVIARYEVSTDPNVADVSSGVILMTIDQPYSNHNAGDLNFSPVDQYLYIAMGDGGSGGDPFCYAQDSMSMLGKMLRIDVDQNINTPPYYAVPADNPFVGVDGALDEIWMLGLRNPWRFVFDPFNGDLYIADVGQGQREEVNYISGSGVGGENFGWKVMEGTFCYDSPPLDNDCPEGIGNCDDDMYTDPIFEYGHDEDGGFSITGGYVLRGCRYPSVSGAYVCTDYISTNSWLVSSDGMSGTVAGAPSSVSTYGVGNNEQIYLATLDGDIYRVNDNTIPRVLRLTQADSPLDGAYSAIDSIIIEDNATVMAGAVLLLSATEVTISDEVVVPSDATITIDPGICGL